MEESNYLESIVKPLLSYPDECRVERIQDERGILLTLFLNQADMGKIIGRAGETAKSIRHLVRCYGAMHQMHLSMKIYEPNRPQKEFVGTRREEFSKSEDEFTL
ncbi:MAG TPA: KH domain-containing protein [Chryseolinea sp.]